MSVYVYSDRQRTHMIGCLENDGCYYDKDINILNSMPQTFYGYVDSSGIVYKDRQRYEPVGAFWDYDNCVYRNHYVVSRSSASERPIAYVYHDEVYTERPASGHYPTGNPILYLEGSGNYGHAAAAALLLRGGASSSRDYDTWSPSSGEDHSTWSGGGSGPVAPDGWWKPLLIMAGIAIVVFWLLFGEACEEKDRQQKEIKEIREKEQQILNDREWIEYSDSFSQYTGYYGKYTRTTDKELYTVNNDCNLTIYAYGFDSGVEVEAFFRHYNTDEKIENGSTVSAKAGEKFEIYVYDRGGDGYFKIDVTEN